MRPGFFAGRLIACRPFAAAFLVCVLAGHPASASPSATLDAARAAGRLACGVVVEQEDFSKTDSHGDLSAFESAICRAVAAATLGSGDRVQLLGFPDDQHGADALRRKQVALQVGTTPDPLQGLLRHVVYSPDLFIDGQGFLVPRRLHLTRPEQLQDKLVCFLQQTPAEPALTEWQARRHVAVRRHPFEERGEMEAALTTGNCQAIMASVSDLADMRSGFHARMSEFEILPQLATLDPLAAATRDDDRVWSAIVSCVVTVLIEAEQQGITRANLQRRGLSDADPSGQRLLGPTPGLAPLLGLENGWARRAIAVGGSYGEIYDRTLGADSPLQLAPRGLNRLWDQAGLIGAPAIP